MLALDATALLSCLNTESPFSHSCNKLTISALHISLGYENQVWEYKQKHLCGSIKRQDNVENVCIIVNDHLSKD